VFRELRHPSHVDAVAFSPDGQLLVTGSWDSVLRVWRVEDCSLIKVLKGHKNIVHGVAFIPDGKLLASASWDSTARLWELK